MRKRIRRRSNDNSPRDASGAVMRDDRKAAQTKCTQDMLRMPVPKGCGFDGLMDNVPLTTGAWITLARYPQPHSPSNSKRFYSGRNERQGPRGLQVGGATLPRLGQSG